MKKTRKQTEVAKFRKVFNISDFLSKYILSSSLLERFLSKAFCFFLQIGNYDNFFLFGSGSLYLRTVSGLKSTWKAIQFFGKGKLGWQVYFILEQTDWDTKLTAPVMVVAGKLKGREEEYFDCHSPKSCWNSVECGDFAVYIRSLESKVYVLDFQGFLVQIQSFSS